MSLKKPSPTATRSEKEAYVKALAAISISVFALLLAITNYFAGRNSSTILNSTISANNMWTWYGTKNVRATIHEVAGSKDEAVRLRGDMEEIEAKARASEATRDAAKTKSPWYSYSAMAIQLAIVLSSAAILAVTLSLFYVSIGVGAIGTALFFIALGA